jgi:hypothetical protein
LSFILLDLFFCCCGTCGNVLQITCLRRNSLH